MEGIITFTLKHLYGITDKYDLSRTLFALNKLKHNGSQSTILRFLAEKGISVSDNLNTRLLSYEEVEDKIKKEGISFIEEYKKHIQLYLAFRKIKRNSKVGKCLVNGIYKLIK